MVSSSAFWIRWDCRRTDGAAVSARSESCRLMRNGSPTMTLVGARTSDDKMETMPGWRRVAKGARARWEHHGQYVGHNRRPTIQRWEDHADSSSRNTCGGHHSRDLDVVSRGSVPVHGLHGIARHGEELAVVRVSAAIVAEALRATAALSCARDQYSGNQFTPYRKQHPAACMRQ
jgi:hypothetical protein